MVIRGLVHLTDIQDPHNASRNIDTSDRALEPSALLLFVIGMIGLGFARRRKA